MVLILVKMGVIGMPLIVGSVVVHLIGTMVGIDAKEVAISFVKVVFKLQ